MTEIPVCNENVLPRQDLHPYLFTVYLRANAMVPQASDGIKWMMHHAFFAKSVVSLGNFAVSQFSDHQLAELRIKTNAIHQANNIPFQSPTQEAPVIPAQKTPVHDHDYQILLTRVRYSLVNNLLADKHFTQTGEALPGYKNDFGHDVRVPTTEMIKDAPEYAITSEANPYKEVLSIIVKILQSKEGKALLKRYREEFSVNRKRTSSVWRQDGYSQQFADLVVANLSDFNLDLSLPHVQYLLYLNNLSFGKLNSTE